MGLTLAVDDITKARSLIGGKTNRDLPIYEGVYGKSFLVPPEVASGVWIEMVEK
jgi:hypothetical protein